MSCAQLQALGWAGLRSDPPLKVAVIIPAWPRAVVRHRSPKSARTRAGAAPAPVVSPAMLMAGAQVLARAESQSQSQSPYELVGEIYRAMKRLAPQRPDAGLPTPTMLQALAMLDRNPKDS